ncbi:hypothetical protein [Natronorubrum sp. DTA7]|uniref:hypothetical protein n=1 Tax=Natronorubrum sp. DTA7 TaxID=3447016 RepID=UPI003F87E765
MAVPFGILNAFFLLGILAAVLAAIYFVFRRLQDDHATGEYHFTWAVGIVVLFLLGLAPGFVGLGLYLTIEREYPLYWLVLCLLLVFVILIFAGFGLYTGTEVVVTDGEVPLSVAHD